MVVVICYNVYVLRDMNTLGIKVRRFSVDLEWEQISNIILRVTIMLNGDGVQ